MNYIAETVPTGGIILRDFCSGKISFRVSVSDASGLAGSHEIEKWIASIINFSEVAFPLTSHELMVMRHCQDKYDEDNSCPSIREIRSELDFSSISHVHKILLRLEKKGYIRRVKGKQRNIVIVRRLKDVRHQDFKATETVMENGVPVHKCPPAYAIGYGFGRTIKKTHSHAVED